MDLKSGYPFWAVKNGLMQAFPELRQDLACDVLVLGGGITGAIMAREMANGGHDVALIEQRDIAWGSTAASTALLQYEIDTHMTELAERYGLANAALAYGACVDAIPLLKSLSSEVHDVDFAEMRSLYYASSIFHVRRLRKEYELRQCLGVKMELLPRAALKQRFGFGAPIAILSGLAARVDPYRLTSRLLAQLRKRGVRIYDRTELASFKAGGRGIVARTASGMTIRAKHLIVAAGYAAQHYIDQRVARNRSSYALVTDPLESGALGFLRNTLMWESARPYLYLRSTGDRRLMIGGEDDDIDIPPRRDARVQRKATILCKRISKLFPGLQIRPAFSWAGTFAETSDGLPFFGPHPRHGPRVHFAMAYGGNGITYSAIGADLIARLIRREKHPLAKLFSFERLEFSSWRRADSE